LLRRWEVLLLLGWVTTVHLVATLAWLSMDNSSVYWVPDDFAHTAALQQLMASLELGGVKAALAYTREISSYYPYLAHFPLALFSLLFGSPHVTTRLANVLYFVVLLAAVYDIGRLCHSRRAGVLAAVLVSLMPAVYGGWRTVGLDFPALSMTAVAMLALLRCDDFRKPWMAAAFGVAAGLAALAKGQSLLFLVWPAAFSLGRGLYLDLARGQRRRVVLGAALSLAALAVSTSIWWGGRVGYILQIMGAHVTGEGMLEYEYDISLAGGVEYFLRSFPLLTSGPLLLAALVLAPLAFRRCRRRWMIVVWIAAPLILHMVLKVRHFRYLFPLVPAVAVFLAVGLSSLRPRVRGAVTAAVVGVALVLWLACSFYSGQRREAEPGGLWQYLTARADLPRSLPGYCLACGPYSFAATKDRGALLPSLFRGGEAAARELNRRHPGGERVVLYYAIETINYALYLQSRLPGLRISLRSDCTWSDYVQFAPPAGWAAYALLTTTGATPGFVDDLVLRTKIKKTLSDQPVDWGGLDMSMILWKLGPRDRPPPLEHFRCDFVPMLLDARHVQKR